jgi:hypothetical protein
MSLTIPVGFFIFNRPHLTERVFQAIAGVRPKKLLVVADGPRFPEEKEKCMQAREIVLSGMNWDCEVITNFSETNLGCKRRISTGLDWVFSQVPEAIILEDDCLPAPSFFDFCQTLLNRYRDDERIMMISGDKFQKNVPTDSASYYFSKYVHIWGWASWRRAWKHYDVEMRNWPEYKASGNLRSLCPDPDEQRYWGGLFDMTFEGKMDSWAYQWCYACWSQNGLTILPKSNLVSNIGFGAGATHLTGHDQRAALPTQDIWEIKHPPFVARDEKADQNFFEYFLRDRAKAHREKTIIRLRQRLSLVWKRLAHSLNFQGL